MDAVRHLAEVGAPEGLVVTAEHQTRGRGRYSRRWIAKRGQSLLASILLRPSISIHQYPRLTLALALAVEKTLRRLGLRPRIKWPNDVLVRGKKICGILVEAHRDRNGKSFVVAGLGLNVSQKERDFSAPLRGEATSIRMEGLSTTPSRVLSLILKNLDSVRRMSGGFKHGAWMAAQAARRSASVGRRIQVRVGKRLVEGKAAGLGSLGELIVRDQEGLRHRITAGDVEYLD